jgi:selenophosphate synthase
MINFNEIAKEIGELVTEKNKAYGDSFAKTGEHLKLLYPDGIKPDQYGDALTLVRILDKMMRIATKKDAFGESPYRDIAGYGILGVAKDMEGKDLDLL